jgi:hypothetical protein
MRNRTLCGAILTVAISACAGPPPIPVLGPKLDLDQLAGEWTGSYTSPETRREGSLWFKLAAADDHAHGDVIMNPGDRSFAAVRSAERPAPQLLSIRFAIVGGGEVAGALEPYQDPECDCEARTYYRGRLSGDALTGQFITRRQTGSVVRGTWRAIRHRR